MARSFGGAASISASPGASLTAYPFTFACWAQSSTIATFGYALTWGNFASAVNAHALGFRGDVGGDPLEFYRSNTSSKSTQGGTYAADTWVHLAGRAVSATDADLFVNGSPTHDTTNITIGTLNKLAVGAFFASSAFSAFLSGKAAEAAFWSAALSDDEIKSLAKGFQPWRVRYASQVAYLPLVRRVSSAYSDTGSTQSADHPRSLGGATI